MLIDTAGFLALHSAKDRNHPAAKEAYEEARFRLTTNYILAEYVALALIRGVPREQVLAFSAEALTDRAIEIVWVDEALHTEAVVLMRARQDKSYSLCDAVSFVLMRQRSLTEALTTDKHFVQEGFVRLLPP